VVAAIKTQNKNMGDNDPSQNKTAVQTGTMALSNGAAALNSVAATANNGLAQSDNRTTLDTQLIRDKDQYIIQQNVYVEALYEIIN
jgi:hypothetical protein